MANNRLRAGPLGGNPKANSATDAAIDSGMAGIDAIIDAQVASQQSLYDQEAALVEQIKDLSMQRNTLRVQIAETESEDVKKARAIKQAIESVQSGRGRPFMR